MPRNIKTWGDAYGEGFITCKPKYITLNPGLTVLVGCNGAGKTTLIQNIIDEVKKAKVPVVSFDNLSDGGHSAFDSAFFNNDFGLAGSLMSSSEGESIGINISMWLSGIRNFIKTGSYNRNRREDRIVEVFRGLGGDDSLAAHEKIKKESEVNPERWILLDAADSGYSVDNVIDLKDIFSLILKDGKAFGKDVYIIIAANEYELARGEQCFDVNAGKYLTFKDYEEYRSFVIKTRKRKDKRYARLSKRQELARQKAEEKQSSQRKEHIRRGL